MCVVSVSRVCLCVCFFILLFMSRTDSWENRQDGGGKNAEERKSTRSLERDSVLRDRQRERAKACVCVRVRA